MAGSVSVAVVGAAGYGFEDCGEIYGNELFREVTWKGKALDDFKGSETVLAFELNEAFLYAIKGG